MNDLFSTDISWDSSKFTLEIKNSNILIDSTKVEYSEKPSKPSKTFVSTDDYKNITEIKNKIPNCTNWEKWCKLTNPYDKVQQVASGYKNDKDFFKYLEILKFYV